MAGTKMAIDSLEVKTTAAPTVGRLETMCNHVLAVNLLKFVRNGIFTTASPWKEDSCLSVKAFLQKLTETTRMALYLELFVDDFGDPLFSLLPPVRAVLLWWLLLKSPLQQQQLLNPTMACWICQIPDFVRAFNLILARFLSEKEQHNSFHSLSFKLSFTDFLPVDDEQLPLADYDILTSAIHNQPNLRKLELFNLCSEAILGIVCAEISAPLQELVVKVQERSCFGKQPFKLSLAVIQHSVRTGLSRHSDTLTTLELSFPNAHSSLFVNEVRTCCPNLTKLALCEEYPSRGDRDQQQAPFLSIKDLSLKGNSNIDLYFIHAAYPNVSSLKLHGYGIKINQRQQQQSSFPSIKVLTMKCDYFSNIDLCFINTAYPNVSSLKLIGDGIKIDVNSLVHLQALSHCITELQCKVDSEVQVWQVLSRCQRASKIHLGYERDKVEQSVLSLAAGEAIIKLPCLKDLSIQRLCNIRAEDIVHLLESCLVLEQLHFDCQLYPNFNLTGVTALVKLLRKKRVLRYLKELNLEILEWSPTSSLLLMELMSLPDIKLISGLGWCKLDKGGMERVLVMAKEKNMEVKFLRYVIYHGDDNCTVS